MDLLKQFKKLKTDQEKWKFVIANKDKGITVMLDNDDTFVVFEGSDDYGDFYSYLGNSDGVVELLISLGIESDGV